MANRATSVENAIKLMNRALLLLDGAGEKVAAAHLQHAIDTARNVPVASFTDP